MKTFTLSAEARDTGKGAVKAVRREGEVPGVLYGPHQEPVHFRVPVLSLRGLIYTSETQRVSLELSGETYDCILKTVDFDPITDVPMHVDFQALTAGEKITIEVPVQLVGDAPGVLGGGELVQPLNSITVACLPKDMPSHVEVDISSLQIGDTLHVSDISVENAEIVTEDARTIVSVIAPRVEEEPEAASIEDALMGEAAAEAAADDEAEGEGEAQPEA